LVANGQNFIDKFTLYRVFLNLLIDQMENLIEEILFDTLF
jgi:hypothetical protein